MITITLQFKTIDGALDALAAIPAKELVGSPEPEATPAPKPSRAAKPAPAAQAPDATSPATAPAPAAPVETAPTPASDTTPPAAAPSVEYPVLQKAVFALAGKSREAAAAVAASFGVKTFKELDSTKWADALAAVNAKLAEV